MHIIIYIYSNLILFTPLLVGFIFVFRTGRFFLGTMITWISLVVCTFFVAVISPYIVAHFNMNLVPFFPEGPAVVLVAFYGWLPSFLICLFAKVLRLIISRYIRRSSSSQMPKTPKKSVFLLGIIFALCLFLFIPHNNTYAKTLERTCGQKDVQAVATEIEFALRYDFRTYKTSELFLRVNVPKSIPKRQKITGIEYSQEPYMVFCKNGNDYANFYFKNPPETISIEINIKGELYDYDLFVALQDQNDLLTAPADINEYLKPERMIEVNDPAIQETAAGIGGDSRIQIVENIYYYVIKHMEPDTGREKSSGALQALKTGKGMCLDCCDLFVALCRAKNIPARIVSGYLIDYIKRPMHAWVEVYFENMGWVPFDTTLSEQRPLPFRIRTFAKLPTRYVHFTHIRNDEHLNYGLIHFVGYKDGYIDLKPSIKFKKPITRIYEGP